MCVSGGGDLHVKDRIKTIEVQEKKWRKQTRWVVDRITPALVWGKKGFCFQSEGRSSANFLKGCHMNNSGRFLFFACFAVIASITSQLAKL